MRWLALVTLLLAGFVGLVGSAEQKTPADLPIEHFAVHEWGVWRVHDDVELANADARAEWDGLPKFVYGQTAGRDFPRHSSLPRVVKKPVIFFHAPKPLRVDVRVEFSSGTPAVWWPGTFNPGYHDDGSGLPPRTPERPARFLEWKLHLKEPFWGKAQVAERKPADKAKWFETLRAVKCDEVYAEVGELNIGLERERFVYYDGLLRGARAVTVTAAKEKATLRNEAKYAVFDTWVIDRRDADRPRVGRLPRLEAGEAKDVDLAAPAEARWQDEAAKALTAELKGAGLNEDEAQSLTTIWADDFFRGAGVTLLYRLPQEEYDRLLPLTVKPRPEKVVRVGLVQQVSSGPELAERVARLVKQLDDDDFNKREAAQRELEKLGGAALGPLRRLQPTVFAAEPKRRLSEVLEKIDAERAIRK
jgi:hypothetical protein